jgi:hypothetical protein
MTVRIGSATNQEAALEAIPHPLVRNVLGTRNGVELEQVALHLRYSNPM